MLGAIGLGAIAALLRDRALRPLALAEDDPLVTNATRRARQSLADFRRLRVEGARPAAVKFPFSTDGGETENVWGEVLALHADDVVARIVSRPVTQRAKLPARLRVPLTAIEDWAITLADGSVRGSFSTLAMIAACRRDGRPIPRRLRSVRFLDGDEPAPEVAHGAAS